MAWLSFVFPMLWWSFGALLLTHLAETKLRGWLSVSRWLVLLGGAGLWWVAGKLLLWAVIWALT